MMKDEWKYYNHAAIPNCAPHEMPELSAINDGSIWHLFGDSKPILARWTENWDCGYETNWWYVIKDTPFDISSLKAKRRYEINRGMKSFEIIKIDNTSTYAKQIYEVTKDAYEGYPRAYRPVIDRDTFIADVKKWSGYDIYGAISKEDGLLKAWARLKPYETYSNFEMLRAERSQEKLGVNAAIVYGILSDYNHKLANGYYICDGTRSISHETAFQDYLEKYFEFRRAYCKLFIEYAPRLQLPMKVLFPLRKLIMHFPNSGIYS